MTGKNHLLQKVTFEIGLASQEGAFEIQNRISDVFQSEVMREMEKLFDEICGPGKVITIEKIEIDLGRLNAAVLEEEFTEAVAKHVEGFLATLREEIRQAEQSFSSTNVYRDIRVRWPLANNAQFEAEVTIADEYISQFEKVAYLLEHGIFPVSIPAGNKARLPELIGPVLSEQPGQLVSFIRNNIANKRILQRLVLNLAIPQRQYIAALLGCSFSYDLPAVASELISFLEAQSITANDFRKSAPLNFTSLESIAWFSILAHYAHRDENIAVSEAQSANDKVVLLMRIILSEHEVLHKILDAFNAETFSPATKEAGKPSRKGATTSPAIGRTVKTRAKIKAWPLIEEALHIILKSVQPEVLSILKKKSNKAGDSETPVAGKDIAAWLKQRNDTGHETGSITGRGTVPGEQNSETLPGADLLPSISDKKSPVPSTTSRAQSIFDFEDRSSGNGDEMAQLEAGIYVHNAGLILLAPFLRMLFSNLNLLEGKDFRDAESAHRGVHVLQYACGFISEDDKGWSEDDLFFNKILCGVEVSEPVPEHISLSEQDKEEVEGLLKGVLNNWSILQRSSIQTLQATFLQKQGRIKKSGADWEMLVERDSAVEILIDKLPWSISTVKLPWNNYCIHTQW